MRVVLNRKTFEPALPHMPVTPVMPMVAPDMTGHPPLHERAESGSGSGLHNQMKMIGHETDGEHLDGKVPFGQGKQVEEGRVVAVLVEHGRAAVATIEHMVGVSGGLSARNARHGRSRVRQMEGGEQEKVACPLFFSLGDFC